MRGDGQDLRAVAVRIVESLDQVGVTRATRCGAYGKLAGDEGFGSGGKRRSFLVAHVNPFNGGLANLVDDWVKAIAHQPEDSFNALLFESLYQL